MSKIKLTYPQQQRLHGLDSSIRRFPKESLMDKRDRIRMYNSVGSSGTANFVYLSIPEAPTFGTTTTIDPTDTNIITADLGGNTDIILGEGTHLANVYLDTIVGTEGTPLRFKGEGGKDNVALTTVGDGTLTANPALFGGDSEWIEVYELKIYGGHCFVFEQRCENFLLQNVLIEGDNTAGFSGVRSKTDGDATVTPYNAVIKYCEIFNVIGESIYLGEVVGAVHHNLSNVLVEHVYSHHSGREPIQLCHAENFDINHFTGLDGAWKDESGQNRALQINDSNGTIRNSFLQSFGTLNQAYAISSYGDGVTHFNCFFEAQDPVYLGNQAGKNWYASSTITGNKKILFDSCIFKIGSILQQSDLINVNADLQDIEVRNCIITDNITGLFQGSFVTYNLIDGGGNTYVDASDPIFNPTFDSSGRVTSSVHYNRGMGYLVNDPDLATYATNTLSGTETEGETLTATVGGGDAGSGSTITDTKYQWYRADNGSGLNKAAIQSATSSTYTLVAADQGKYILCSAQPVNDIPMTGEAKESAYTGAIAAAPFSPFIDIVWQTAIQPSGAVDIATNEYWTNEGTTGNLTKDGTEDMPSYVAGKVEFTQADSDRLSLPAVSHTTDWEIWIEFTPDNTASQGMFGIGSAQTLKTDSGGALTFSSGTLLGYTAVIGNTYRIHLYVNGATSTVEIRDDSNVVLVAETTITFAETATGIFGRLGTLSNGAQAFGGDIKYLFIKDGDETANTADMWTWLNDN